MKIVLPAAVAMACIATAVMAEPATYQIDPSHTFPAFEADHFGGLSIWRGKFLQSSGTIVLDQAQNTGTVEVTVKTASIDFGNERLNEEAKSSGAGWFNSDQFPDATFKGTLTKFKNGQPTEVEGQFTLHGVTKPLTLHITQFLCKTNPMNKKDVCGADATGTFNRGDFGVNYAQNYGFNMQTKLLISVEAVKQ